MRRICCALLSLLLVALPLTACADAPDAGEETGSLPAVSDPEGTGGETETEETLDIPNTRYDGATLTFLTRDEGSWGTVEIYAEEPDDRSDNISNAVYERNDLILQRYGVAIRELKTTDAETPGRISNEVSAPTGDFSVCVTSADRAAPLSSKGYLWNLLSDDIRYINMEKSWWDVNLAKGISIDHRLYFGAGDLMTLDNDATFVILFNKTMAGNLQIPDLYQTVEDFEWTLDRLYEYEQKAASDQNNDGKLDYHNDVCGLAYTNDSRLCLMYGGGVIVTTKDEDDMPLFSLDVEHAQDTAEKCFNVLSYDFNINMNDPPDPDIEGIGRKTFGGNHALFFGEVMQSVTRFRGLDVDFGILPYPMFDNRQGAYRSVMHATGTVVSIPRSVSETGGRNTLPMVESIVEAMACLSQPTLTKQYYDINLKTKDSKDPESGPMMDMILANRVFDPAYYFDWASSASTIRSFTEKGGAGVAASAKRMQAPCERGIRRTISAMEKSDKP